MSNLCHVRGLICLSRRFLQHPRKRKDPPPLQEFRKRSFDKSFAQFKSAKEYDSAPDVSKIALIQPKSRPTTKVGFLDDEMEVEVKKEDEDVQRNSLVTNGAIDVIAEDEAYIFVYKPPGLEISRNSMYLFNILHIYNNKTQRYDMPSKPGCRESANRSTKAKKINEDLNCRFMRCLWHTGGEEIKRETEYVCVCFFFFEFGSCIISVYVFILYYFVKLGRIDKRKRKMEKVKLYSCCVHVKWNRVFHLGNRAWLKDCLQEIFRCYKRYYVYPLHESSARVRETASKIQTRYQVVDTFVHGFLGTISVICFTPINDECNHQIRASARSLNAPILGDALYEGSSYPNMMLHLLFMGFEGVQDTDLVYAVSAMPKWNHLRSSIWTDKAQYFVQKHLDYLIRNPRPLKTLKHNSKFIFFIQPHINKQNTFQSPLMMQRFLKRVQMENERENKSRDPLLQSSNPKQIKRLPNTAK
ncbi:hypothetical protein RFI_23689 [Reticulomyxa filosa]|uniref:Pseudouridine synthase RsuA/RluA-like domain-containing protein n=1 Tax=Reticulomyxa filosa TaxID=46433 RepID=X6MI40_RETFI|nr:hypothetical protein RFI_23689 [Reticulomyxa filosa]|eukprot:ETO13678.1 hypothetical protein RFI_23689 [Reticulomyxa filosa]